jgi:hypothetical protein
MVALAQSTGSCLPPNICDTKPGVGQSKFPIHWRNRLAAVPKPFVVNSNSALKS